MNLPDKYYILDLEYGDEIVAQKNGRMACILAIGLIQVEGQEITREFEWYFKPLHPEEVTEKIQALIGRTQEEMNRCAGCYEGIKTTIDIIRNKTVFHWGHSDSIKLRYWANVLEIPGIRPQFVDAYSFLRGAGFDTRVRLEAEARNRGFRTEGIHSSPVYDCKLVYDVLNDAAEDPEPFELC